MQQYILGLDTLLDFKIYCFLSSFNLIYSNFIYLSHSSKDSQTFTIIVYIDKQHKKWQHRAIFKKSKFNNSR